jgi:hypothetical protein
MTRIVWTKDEKRAIKDCMIDICYVTPTMSNKGLLQHAQQEVIPYERRQKITDQKVFSHKLMINEARAAAEKHRQAVSKPKPAPTPPPVIAPEPTPEPIAPPTFEATLGGIFEQLVDAITERVMLQVTNRLKDRLTGDVSVVAGESLNELDRIFDGLYPPKPKAPCKPLLPTVTIIGLNGQQIDAIKSSYPRAMYCFMTAEEAKTRPVQFNDHVILMTKFINHSVQTKYRKHPNLHYCNGGVSDLKHQLQIIFHKETA